MDKEDYVGQPAELNMGHGSVICAFENVTLRAKQAKKLAVSLNT